MRVQPDDIARAIALAGTIRAHTDAVYPRTRPKRASGGSASSVSGEGGFSPPEGWEEYRSGSYSRPRPGFYDPRYFDKEPDELRALPEDGGHLLAEKDRLNRKPHLVDGFDLGDSLPRSDDVIYRGMSHEEFEDALKRGHIQSHGEYNIGPSQKGLTYFSKWPAQAVSYAHGFAPKQFKATPGRPAYVVAVKRPPEEHIRHVHGTDPNEVGVSAPVPMEHVRGVWRGTPVEYTPPDEHGYGPEAQLHWEQIHPPREARASGGGVFEPPDEISRALYADGGPVQPQRQLTPLGLYSKAAEVARGLPQAKGTPQQFAAMLQKGGVKPEEMQHAGYEQAFGHEPSVTRDEVAQHFQNSLPDVQQKTYGGSDPDNPYGYETEAEWSDALDRADANHYRDEDEYDEDAGDYDDLNHHYAKWQERQPKYDNYRMPGGKNYREVVLHLPSAEQQMPKELRELSYGLTKAELNHLVNNVHTLDDVHNARTFYGTFREATRRYAPEDVLNAFAEMRARAQSNAPLPAYARDPYKSGHWDEPNVLAHLRMTDREVQPEAAAFDPAEMKGIEERLIPRAQAHKDAGNAPIGLRELLMTAAKEGILSHDEVSKYAQHRGLAPRMRPDRQKILHLDELQSDWAQDARRNGVFDPANPWEVFDTATGKNVSAHPNEEAAKAALAQLPNDGAGHDYDRAEKTNKVPPGPYIGNTNSWVDFGLKHALMEAAKGNYHKLVWTPGEEHARRYDLSNHIGMIEHQPDGEGTHAVHAYDPYGSRRVFSRYGMKPDDLESHFGKEIAQKIIGGEGEPTHRDPELRVLRGLDLKTGGEGMKGFYDNILPKRLAALVKQHDPDAKLGFHEVPIPTGRNGQATEAHQLPGVEITPRMRESILKGLPAFARGGDVYDMGEQAQKRADASAAKRADYGPYDKWRVRGVSARTGQSSITGSFKQEQTAQDVAAHGNQPRKSGRQPPIRFHAEPIPANDEKRGGAVDAALRVVRSQSE